MATLETAADAVYSPELALLTLTIPAGMLPAGGCRLVVRDAGGDELLAERIVRVVR